MEFRPATEFQCGTAQKADHSAHHIRSKVQQLIVDLETHFNRAQPLDFAELRFTVTQDKRIVGLVASSFGHGRLRLDWRFEPKGVVGVLTLDRERFDDRDRRVWEPVLSGEIADYNDWQGGFAELVTEGIQREKKMTPTFARGMSILYSIIGGAVLKDVPATLPVGS